MPNRTNIPSDVARQLRQEAGFGCCVCGRPVFQYHHIIPWSEEEHYRPEDMMCLCPNHHDEATQGALKLEEQRRAKSEPENVKKGYTDGQLKVSQSVPIVQIGSCNIVGDGDFFVVDENSLLGFDIEDGRLLVSAKIYNSDNNLVLEIARNEWVTGDPGPWDIKHGYQKLKIWHKSRDIGLNLDVSTFPINLTAKFEYNGHNLQVSTRGVAFDNGTIGDVSMTFHNMSFVAATIDANTSERKYAIRPNMRYNNLSFLGSTDISKCVSEWQKLKSPN